VIASLAAAALAQPVAATGQPAEARRFMDRAFAMRQAALDAGDQPYGAIVVKDGRIVAEAPSRVVSRRDPTAHAETEAIRDAARALASRDLSGAVMYSSSRPCPMCMAAAYWAGLSRLYWCEAIADLGAPRLPNY
jgi:tRNA(Arg) A34 adenosine deaminase TadA